MDLKETISKRIVKSYKSRKQKKSINCPYIKKKRKKDSNKVDTIHENTIYGIKYILFLFSTYIYTCSIFLYISSSHTR